MAPRSTSGKHPFYVACTCGLGCCVCGGCSFGVGVWGCGPLVMLCASFVGGGYAWVKCPCGGSGVRPRPLPPPPMRKTTTSTGIQYMG